MYILEEIDNLQKECYELGIKNCCILYRYTDCDLQTICDGTGYELFSWEVCGKIAESVWQ